MHKEALRQMTSEGLINICQAVKHGNLRRVKNIKTNKQGTVINVEGKALTVLVEGDPELWHYEDCKEQHSG